MNQENIFQQIRQFVSDELKIPINKIERNTSLFHDLGVSGDDAIDFLNKFSDEFHVNFSDIHFDDYFWPESSSNPLGLLFYMIFYTIGLLFFKEKLRKFTEENSPKPLTIDDLIYAVKNKKLTPRH